jgi:hypothetical protein
MTEIYFHDRTQEAHQAACLELYNTTGQLRNDGYVWLYSFENDAFEKSTHTNAEAQPTVDVKQAELWLDDLRAERNRRIAETDWWANSDLTMTAEQTAYRQALRDITQTYTSLEDVVWPTKPEV